MLDRDDIAELSKRLDRIEAKLDLYLPRIAQTEADITWIKGYIKISLVTIFTLLGGVLLTLIKIHFI